jgi:hypothetical protein
MKVPRPGSPTPATITSATEDGMRFEAAGRQAVAIGNDQQGGGFPRPVLHEFAGLVDGFEQVGFARFVSDVKGDAAGEMEHQLAVLAFLHQHPRLGVEAGGGEAHVVAGDAVEHRLEHPEARCHPGQGPSPASLEQHRRRNIQQHHQVADRLGAPVAVAHQVVEGDQRDQRPCDAGRWRPRAGRATGGSMPAGFPAGPNASAAELAMRRACSHSPTRPQRRGGERGPDGKQMDVSADRS